MMLTAMMTNTVKVFCRNWCTYDFMYLSFDVTMIGYDLREVKNICKTLIYYCLNWNIKILSRFIDQRILAKIGLQYQSLND